MIKCFLLTILVFFCLIGCTNLDREREQLEAEQQKLLTENQKLREENRLLEDQIDKLQRSTQAEQQKLLTENQKLREENRLLEAQIDKLQRSTQKADSVRTDNEKQEEREKSTGLFSRFGFTVLDFQSRRDEFGMVYVIGEVKNTSNTAQGVELQAILRDNTGRVLTESRFWPASIENIMPNESYAFEFPLGEFSNAERIELKIISYQKW